MNDKKGFVDCPFCPVGMGRPILLTSEDPVSGDTVWYVSCHS